MSRKHGTSSGDNCVSNRSDVELSNDYKYCGDEENETAAKVLSRLVHARALVLPFTPSPIGPEMITAAVTREATGIQADVTAVSTASRNNDEFVPPCFHQRIANCVADSGR